MSGADTPDYDKSLYRLAEIYSGTVSAWPETWTSPASLRFKAGRLQQCEVSSFGERRWRDVPQVGADAPDDWRPA